MVGGNDEDLVRGTGDIEKREHSRAIDISSETNAAENPPPGPGSCSPAEVDGDTAKSELPFSKARSIALVVTVTGASFLNVSYTSYPASPCVCHFWYLTN